MIITQENNEIFQKIVELQNNAHYLKKKQCNDNYNEQYYRIFSLKQLTVRVITIMTTGIFESPLLLQ